MAKKMYVKSPIKEDGKMYNVGDEYKGKKAKELSHALTDKSPAIEAKSKPVSESSDKE